MDFRIFEGDVFDVVCDMVIVGKFENEELQGHTLQLDQALEGALRRIIEEEDFKGKDGSCLTVHTLGKLGAKRIAFAGLGEKDKFDLEKIRRATAVAIKKGEDAKAGQIAAVPFAHENLKEEDVLQAMVEGIALSTYRFDKYLEKKEDKKIIEKVEFVTKKTESKQKAIKRGVIVCDGVNFARNIVNEPGNIMTPERLADIANELSKKQGLTCRVYNEDEIEKMQMGAFIAVARGSANPPRFIHLTYEPAVKASSKIAVVGKGLTFDSGGLNIKTGDHMKHMKTDKSGACTVLGLMSILPELQPDKEVHGIVAAVENMPDGNAMRPDDILMAMNGKTIEILNTDAEGRLTLADALSYAVKLKPHRIIDLATLTGACIVALGEYTVGLMGNDERFMKEILEASEHAGEHMWQLPLYEPMKEKIKSDVADLNNTGGRYGGAITAGLFLENFVDSIPWIHMDIAGPAFHEKGWAYNPKGATGIGVRTIIHYLTSK